MKKYRKWLQTTNYKLKEYSIILNEIKIGPQMNYVEERKENLVSTESSKIFILD